MRPDLIDKPDDEIDRRRLLLLILRQPELIHSLRLPQWDLLIRQARAANILGSLYGLFQERALLPSIPAQPLRHLDWADKVAQKHRQAIQWEVHMIESALKETGVPLVLLKGAAYVMAELPAAQGRLFSDIDVMVPKTKLNMVEAALMLHGWESTHHDEYDQRYYRQWMHELPPMQHVKRMTVIDLHHAILPETAAVHPDSKKLLDAAINLGNNPQTQILAPVDMVLHSMVHLFYEGEFHHGLRDLFDIHRLFAHFANDPDFWTQLVPRAKELELGRPLFYALRYMRLMLQTNIPEFVIEQAKACAPNTLLLALMDHLFKRALLPMHRSCDDALTQMARGLLYIRANWLRMPPLLLMRHLFHKAFISPRER
ncbi:nucleotidyltransferase family protein [Undibacterium sp. Jales W-56]|uniref:nucleotidyltransferase domain-containing protein n=1 Tax=Undibacterium sp. Jales W-56 TaxID=2897325 RepID=UPI0021D20773|nr:nucleotidyltransferase family protein [Undibacterium sp. Jales W-56]MCU6434147.1 nucleotidyltransferase family protein [Undibacterium sp. Jales W-56]